MSLRAREQIYRFIAESDGDRVGGMSLVSVFLSEYHARNADEAEELLLGLGEIFESDSGTRLAASAWLVEALAANKVCSSFVEAKLRNRLASIEANSTSSDEAELQALQALRKADLALHSAGKRPDRE